MQGPLIPKLRGQFAEFLSHDSLEHLRILSFPTCVGLRYGLCQVMSLKVFLGVYLPPLSDRPKTRGTLGFQLTPTAFNVLFRQHAAVSPLGHEYSCMGGTGILTGLSSGSPFGYPLAPDLPSDG